MTHRYSALGLDIVAPFPCQGFSTADGQRTGREVAQHVDLDLAGLSWQEAAELRPLAYRALAERSRGPVFLKTHDACGKTPSGADLFPIEATRGCIHIVRDPRDVRLSLAAHDAQSVDRAIAQLSGPGSATDKTTKTRLTEQRGS